MPVPTFQSKTATTFAADATSHNANMPATVNAGDLLVGLISADTTSSLTYTQPSGWSTVVGTTISSDNNNSMAIFAKVAAGTEGGTTVNFATNNSEKAAVHVYRITGWAGTSIAANVVGRIDNQASSANPNPLSQTTPGSVTCDILSIAACGYSASSVLGFTSGPSGYTTTESNGGTDATDGRIASGYKTTTAVSSEDPGTFTYTTAFTSVVATVVIMGTGVGIVPRNNRPLRIWNLRR